MKDEKMLNEGKRANPTLTLSHPTTLALGAGGFGKAL